MIDLKGLPDYMQPSVFVVLDRLPITPNRKIHDNFFAPGSQSLPIEGYTSAIAVAETARS